ncbi:DHA2 family efflux MFS transporter permease subunit [Actinacidiphila alni]|uniref:DHA2 family efflux MFS transporter permease subunit n=1 Tax=Actinacidiphila alni TaxID=380248 RepID=UPI0033F61D71
MSDTERLDPHERRTPSFGWALVITSVAGFMAALDNLVVTTALPSIRQSLGGALSDLEWTVSAYTLTFAVLLMFGAALGDRFGRRKMFLIGISIFTVASAAAALSSGIGALIAARAVQGMGGAIMMPLTLTLLTAAAPKEKRGMAFGIWGAANGLAVACGPLIGGSLTQHISWHWIFWLNVPLGLLLLPLARLKLRESTAPNTRLDFVGTAQISLGLFGIVYALVSTNDHGWTSTRVLAGLIGGAVLVAAFVRHGFTAERPMVPMRMFANRGFAATNATSTLMYVGMFGSIFLLSQFMQTVTGYGPTEAGLRMLPWTGMPMVVAPIAGVLADRIGGRVVVAAGLGLQAVGLGWFAAIVATDVTYAAQLPALIVSGIGMGLFFAPSSALLMGSVRESEQGIASGTNNALREVGGALGIAVLSTIFASQGGYRSATDFVNGLTPALWVGTAVLAVGTVAALFNPTRRALAATAATAAAGSLTVRERREPAEPVNAAH